MFKRSQRVIAVVFAVLAMLTPIAASAQSGTPVASPVASPVTAPGLQGAVDWLIDQQQDDGSWLGFSGEPDAGTTVDAIIALSAAREADMDIGDSLDKAVTWLGSGDVALVYSQTGTGQAAKLVLALVASDIESLEIGGVSLLDLVMQGQDAESGLYGTGLYDHAYALLALVATGSEVPQNAIDFIGTVQADNGGFAWDGATDETMVDSNTTAMIVQALAAVGQGDSDVSVKAVEYLLSTVTEGGASAAVGAEPDANSTALVAQAFISVDEDATMLIANLDAFQNANGAYHWQHTDLTDNSFSTIQVIPAAAKVAFPVIPATFELKDAA